MTRTLATVVVFLLLALCRCGADDKSTLDDAKANWASLLAAIAAKDPVRAQAFVGKTVSAEGARVGERPPLHLKCPLPDQRRLAIGITTTFPTASAEREIGEVMNFKETAVVFARIIGVVRSVNVDQPEMVIEPLSARVTRGF